MDPSIATTWLNLIQEQNLSREERANKYHTKKVMLKAHGSQAYYEIQFSADFMAYCHCITPFQQQNPWPDMLEKPELLGVVADLMDELSKYEPMSTEIPALAPRPVVVERDLSQGLSDLSSALGQYKKSTKGDPFNFVV